MSFAHALWGGYGGRAPEAAMPPRLSAMDALPVSRRPNARWTRGGGRSGSSGGNTFPPTVANAELALDVRRVRDNPVRGRRDVEPGLTVRSCRALAVLYAALAALPVVQQRIQSAATVRLKPRALALPCWCQWTAAWRRRCWRPPVVFPCTVASAAALVVRGAMEMDVDVDSGAIRSAGAPEGHRGGEDEASVAARGVSVGGRCLDMAGGSRSQHTVICEAPPHPGVGGPAQVASVPTARRVGRSRN
ncbi:hypothetical protein EDC01DRAFT_781399 [Geopyxis carbonaria]|nr:hypothetical protein EDC01DRAFT_781399 [Geopyxis carbonaria]